MKKNALRLSLQLTQVPSVCLKDEKSERGKGEKWTLELQ